MRRIIAFSFLVACAAAPHLVTGATISTVLIGDPGNPADLIDGDQFTEGVQRFGAVGQVYRIGTTEVTNSQYAEFLNAKAKSDPLGLYSTYMDLAVSGGITRSGESGSYVYTVKSNMGNKPVNWVSWYDAVRFANWLNNGQGAGDTETGAYTLLGGTAKPSNGLSITRNSGATWFLPSENEWYKAAYYQPAAQGGDADNYWLYPTASNSMPLIAAANAVGDISNPGANVANYEQGADWNGEDGNVTTVGSAGDSSDSFYGTADQGGNLVEWNQALILQSFLGSFRGARGSSWYTGFSYMRSSFRGVYFPTSEESILGFRVAAIATVPEPSTLALAAFGLTSLIACAWRQRRR